MNIGSSYSFAVVRSVRPFLHKSLFRALATVFGADLVAGRRNYLILKYAICVQIFAIKRRKYANVSRAQLLTSFLLHVVLRDCCLNSFDGLVALLVVSFAAERGCCEIGSLSLDCFKHIVTILSMHQVCRIAFKV